LTIARTSALSPKVFTMTPRSILGSGSYPGDLKDT
jgi:hypothetical protein